MLCRTRPVLCSLAKVSTTTLTHGFSSHPPLQANHLYLVTGTVVVLFLLLSIVPRLPFHRLQSYRSLGALLQLRLAFYVYPSLTRVVLRTFVCKAYRDSDGFTKDFLVDDTTVSCDSHSDYFAMHLYAGFMVAVVVFGIPALNLYHLWTWRYPFNRLYSLSNKGFRFPAKAVRAQLGSAMLTYHPVFWAMPFWDVSLLHWEPQPFAHCTHNPR